MQSLSIGYFFHAFEFITLHLLSLMSLDRLFFVKFPLKYHKTVTTRRATILVIVVWVFVLLFSSFPVFGLGDVAYYRNLPVCVVETNLIRNIYFPMTMAIVGLLHVFVIVFCNIWVGCIVQRHIRDVYNPKAVSGVEDASMQEAKGNITKTKILKQLHFVKVLLAVIITNTVTWVPLIAVALGRVLTNNSTAPPPFTITVFVSLLSVGVVHQVIQASLIPELRQLVSLMFCYRRSQQQEQEKLSYYWNTIPLYIVLSLILSSVI